jgi:SAM-dependent methyltransferase
MQVGRQTQHGSDFDEHDLLWAVLTDPGEVSAGWNLEEFFVTGREEVDDVFGALADRGVAIERGRALDVGCGVGRLTRALSEHFKSCDGVDSAAPMIERARELNANHERVRFHHTDAPNLRLFDDGSFDFVLSITALRCMAPEQLPGYLREFLRVLRPGGVAFFSVPERRVLADELPADASRASLTLVSPIPRFTSGGIAPLTVRVRNESRLPWPASAQLSIRHRWRDRDGRIAGVRDAAALIQATVDPAREHELRVATVAPVTAGEYELEIDVFHDLIGWFADRGSSSLKLSVTVAAEPEDDLSLGLRSPNETQVWAREDVTAVLEEASGVVLDVTANHRFGPSIRSLDYVAARAVGPTTTRLQGEPSNAQDVIEAGIRGALRRGAPASGERSEQILAPDPKPSERRRLALRLLDERADLVGFTLTSRWKGAGGPSIALRESLRRAMYQILYRQTEHNRASGELIHSHEAQLQALVATIRAQLDIEGSVDERLAALEHRLAAVEVNSVALARAAARDADRAARARIDYARLTERFRGVTQEIRERQRRYVPHFAGRHDVVDIGCGRGEFLDLLRNVSISAVGVDSDEGMVRRCRELGLDATHDDALNYLRARPEGSHGGIFAGRLVEHLERAEVIELVRLAFSRLQPDGVFVVETVNPMCLLTHTTFHEDFTRTVPVPPLALKWLAESCGFAPVEIEYSSPTPDEYKLRPLPSSTGDKPEVEAFNRGLAAANDLLFGFQEYALVAHRRT